MRNYRTNTNGFRKVFGDRLRELRKENLMSQQQLGRAIGFHQPQIERIENGTRKLGFEEAVFFAQFFQVSVDEFAGFVPKLTLTAEVLRQQKIAALKNEIAKLEAGDA